MKNPRAGCQVVLLIDVAKMGTGAVKGSIVFTNQNVLTFNSGEDQINYPARSCDTYLVIDN